MAEKVFAMAPCLMGGRPLANPSAPSVPVGLRSATQHHWLGPNTPWDWNRCRTPFTHFQHCSTTPVYVYIICHTWCLRWSVSHFRAPRCAHCAFAGSCACPAHNKGPGAKWGNASASQGWCCSVSELKAKKSPQSLHSLIN